MPETATTTPKKPAKMRRVNPECAGMFNVVLPNGVRLGDASLADLEAAVVPYAEKSSHRGRLVRELLILARKFENGAFQG